jgi:hypothetical protein
MSTRPSPSEHAGDHKWVVKKGHDENDYISRPDKNGVFHWKKIENKMSAFDYYQQFQNPPKPKYDCTKFVATFLKVATELKKSNVYCFEIGWVGVGNFIDNAWEVATENIEKTAHYKKLLSKIPKGKIVTPIDLVSFAFYTNHRLFWASIKGEMVLQHNLLKSDKELVHATFQKHFGKSLVWPARRDKGIIIKLDKLR